MKKRRRDRGLLQADVARLVGVDKWTVLNWERGKTAPEVRFYPAILTFLGYNPLPVGETFPERLKAARQARGLSWKRLAEELGVWETTVRHWEYGIHEPTRLLRKRVERYLHLKREGPRSSPLVSNRSPKST